MNLNEIKELIDKVTDADVGELKIEQGDFKLSIRSKAYIEANQKNKVMVSQVAPALPASAPSLAATAPVVSTETVQSASGAEPSKTTEADNIITINAPMIGTFYRASAPDKPPFVKVGDTISKGDTICMIEAMKLFNEIESEVSGTVVKILVDDASPVEYDQPVMLVEPA